MTSTDVQRIGWVDGDIEFLPSKKSQKYSPDQPRDDHGRFGEGDGGGNGADKTPYFHVSPRPLKIGTVLTPGGGHPNFAGHADSDAVYMAESESDAERWGQAMAEDDTGVNRLYVYEVRPHGEVVHGSASIVGTDGFAEDVPEHRAEKATVERLVYSFDPVTGDATYPEKSLKFDETEARDERGRWTSGGPSSPSPMEAAKLVEEGAPPHAAYRAITASDYEALRRGEPLPAGRGNEERLGHGAAFRMAHADQVLRYVEPGVEHRIIRIDTAHPDFAGHAHAGYPGDVAIDAPVTMEHVDKVSPPFRRGKSLKRDVADEARDEGGRWTDGGGVTQTRSQKFANPNGEHYTAEDYQKWDPKFLNGAWWHGTPSGRIEHGEQGDVVAHYGIHVGSREAARQALEARIGQRSDGKDWDGTTEYGKTLVAGTGTGYGGSSEPHYPEPAYYVHPVRQADGSWGNGPRTSYEDRDPGLNYNSVGAVYSDGSPVPMDAKPNLMPVRITGGMTNEPLPVATETGDYVHGPMTDVQANARMAGQITRGHAVNGYFYTENGEDEGSIAAVVPKVSHLQTHEQWKQGKSAKPKWETVSLADLKLRIEIERLKGDTYDEAQHPRDDHGRWTDSGGGDTAIYFQPSAHQGGRYEGENLNRVLNPAYDKILTEHEASLAKSFPKAYISIEGMHPDLMKEFDDRSKGFAREFPKIAANVKEIEVGTFDDDHLYAYVANGGTRLRFNERWYAEPEDFRNSMQESYDTGWHPQGTTSSVIDHELGHVLDSQTRPGHVEGELMKPFDDNNISGYAETSNTEAFAEAFAVRQNDGMKDWAGNPAIATAINDRVREAGGDPTKSAKDTGHTCAGYIPDAIVRKYGKKAFDPNEPRDDHGRWTSDGGGGVAVAEKPTEARPEFEHSHARPVAKLAIGKLGYIHEHGLPDPPPKDWQSITADPKLQSKWASDFDAMHNGDSPETRAAYDVFAKENAAQYEYLTKTLGVKVEMLDHDPYRNVDEMIADVRDNNHLGVLSTETTGPHQYLTNEQNDQFRATHDAFGHASIGRGFDRNGEEAAYQSHQQMYTPEAQKALATETRGQNAVLITTGSFPDQRIGVLPPEDVKKRRNPDDDNNYAVTLCHHTSCGRTLANKSKALDEWARSRKTEFVVRERSVPDDTDWSEVDAWLVRNDVKSFDVLRAVHEQTHPGEPFRYHRWKRDVSDEARDDSGRWTDGGINGTAGEPVQLSRAGSITKNAKPDSAISTHAIEQAKKVEGEDAAYGQFLQGEPYNSAVDYAPYAAVDPARMDEASGNYDPPETWQPGTVDAASQAASAWQQSYGNAEGIQIAADALLGYGWKPDLPGDYDPVAPEYAAYARELLTQMTGNGVEGAASAGAMGDMGYEDVHLHTEDFGTGELARGISADDDMRETIMNSFYNDEPLQWSMASFVAGGELGDKRIEWMQSELGENPPELEDPETGETRPQTGSEQAAGSALKYTIPDHNLAPAYLGQQEAIDPMLILGEGNGLVVDGNFEVVMGGKFLVTDVHTATPEERFVWKADDTIGQQDLTVVRIKQTENVKLPPGVSTA